MKKSSNTNTNNLGAWLDEFSNVEHKLATYTKKHPGTMLAAAVGLGFSIGCFGLIRVFQAGVALNLQDKVSLKDFFPTKDKTASESHHGSPHAQA